MMKHAQQQQQQPKGVADAVSSLPPARTIPSSTPLSETNLAQHNTLLLSHQSSTRPPRHGGSGGPSRLLLGGSRRSASPLMSEQQQQQCSVQEVLQQQEQSRRLRFSKNDLHHLHPDHLKQGGVFRSLDGIGADPRLQRRPLPTNPLDSSGGRPMSSSLSVASFNGVAPPSLRSLQQRQQSLQGDDDDVSGYRLLNQSSGSTHRSTSQQQSMLRYIAGFGNGNGSPMATAAGRGAKAVAALHMQEGRRREEEEDEGHDRVGGGVGGVGSSRRPPPPPSSMGSRATTVALENAMMLESLEAQLQEERRQRQSMEERIRALTEKLGARPQ